VSACRRVGVSAMGRIGVQRSAFGVRRSAFGVRRSAGVVRTSVTLMGQDIGNTVCFVRVICSLPARKAAFSAVCEASPLCFFGPGASAQNREEFAHIVRTCRVSAKADVIRLSADTGTDSFPPPPINTGNCLDTELPSAKVRQSSRCCGDPPCLRGAAAPIGARTLIGVFCAIWGVSQGVSQQFLTAFATEDHLAGSHHKSESSFQQASLELVKRTRVNRSIVLS
jgi:hypothetical protein